MFCATVSNCTSALVEHCREMQERDTGTWWQLAHGKGSPEEDSVCQLNLPVGGVMCHFPQSGQLTLWLILCPAGKIEIKIVTTGSLGDDDDDAHWLSEEDTKNLKDIFFNILVRI